MGICSICGEQHPTAQPPTFVLDACEMFFGLKIPKETRESETCVWCDQPWFDLEDMTHRIQTREREIAT